MYRTSQVPCKMLYYYRRALWQQLINIVYPILAEVIAFCDYNDNLQLLDTSKELWIRNLWLAIFGDLKLAPLQYTDMVSPAGSSSAGSIDPSETDSSLETLPPASAHGDLQALPLREKIPDRTFSDSGKPFIASFPFSWLIKKHIDRRYEISKETKGTISFVLRGLKNTRQIAHYIRL